MFSLLQVKTDLRKLFSFSREVENCIQYNNTFLYALQIWLQSFYSAVTFCFLLQILNVPSMRKALVTITEQYRQHNSDIIAGKYFIVCLAPTGNSPKAVAADTEMLRKQREPVASAWDRVWATGGCVLLLSASYTSVGESAWGPPCNRSWTCTEHDQEKAGKFVLFQPLSWM